jgi:phosphoesterase RecJ-like protein
MKKRGIKEMAKKISKEEAIQFLNDHSHFLLIGHYHPDGDDVGSICALHNVLVGLGKEADMVLADPVPDHFQFLETSKLIHLQVPEGKSYDAVIFTDLANRERAGELAIPEDVPSLCIDHHVSNEGYTDYLYLRSDYAATAELLSEMFFDMHVTMDKDTCNALYLALGTDSGFFKYSCTSAHTLLMASRLVEMGAEPAFISNRLDVTTKKGMETYKRVLDTLHFASNGRIGIAYMDKESMALDGPNSDYYVSIPRRVEGVEVAFLLKYQDENTTRVSLRSREYVNVSELAAHFGGGGHIRASGCTIHLPFREAEEALVKETEKYL